MDSVYLDLHGHYFIRKKDNKLEVYRINDEPGIDWRGIGEIIAYELAPEYNTVYTIHFPVDSIITSKLRIITKDEFLKKLKEVF